MKLKKYFSPIGIGAASALISITTLLSYIAGLIRDRTIAVHFGTTSATDAYNASFLIPDTLFNLFIAGALVAAFMPVFSEYLHKNKEEAFSIANTVLTGASMLIAVLMAISFIFMDKIVPFVFPSVDPVNQKDIIFMTRLMLPAAFIFAISNTIGNVVMTYRHFLSFGLSPILYNLGIIFGILFFNETLGIYSAAAGVLIGATLHMLVRIIDAFYTEYRYKPELKLRHPGFKKIVKLMIPKSISLFFWQVNLYIFAIVGMKMVEGGLAAFNFARNIQSVAVSIFGVAFATAVFPALNSDLNTGDKVSFTKNIQKTVQRILFFTIPSMVGLALLARPITALILGGGEFGENSLNLTSKILIFFAISIPFESLTQIFSRAYYAMKDTFTPMLMNIFSFAIIAAVTIFVAPKFGIGWFSIGYTIGFIIYDILFLLGLKKHFQGFELREFIKSLLKMFVAAGTMGIIIYFSKDLSPYINLPEKIIYVLRIVVGAGIYLSMAYLIKSPELSSTGIIFKKLFKKNV